MPQDVKSTITFDHFLELDLKVGTILEAYPSEKARKPAYVLKIDFGKDVGIKTSSAQITEVHQAEEIIGRQIVAVMNSEPKRVAGIKSEVLVLAALCPHAGTTLLTPMKPVADGSNIA